MSWLSELAGKAENILNKIDQNAATVLQQKNDTEPLVEIRCGNENEEQPKVSINFLSTPDISFGQKNIMSLTKSSPKRKALSIVSSSNSISEMWNISEQPIMGTDELACLIKSENQNNSHQSSRRSSFSSKLDGSVIERPPSDTSKNLVGRNFDIMTPYSLERELAATKIILAEIKSERDELKNELDTITQMNNVSKKVKLKEMETVCTILETEKNGLIQANQRLEDSNTKYIKSISELEITVSKLQQTESELAEKFQWAKSEADQAVLELQQYRSRAQNTLQMKDKIIEELKAGSSNVDCDPTLSNLSQIATLELEQMKTEKSLLLDELANLKEQLDYSRSYINKIEGKYNDFQLQQEKKIEELQEKVKLEQRHSRQYEDEIRAQNQELLTLRDEMTRQGSVLSMKLHQKETELTKFKCKSMQRSTSPDSFGLEERLQSLTQSLVQKQTTLEAITAERNALKIQLEKMENQHRTAVMQIRQQRSPVINVNDTDDAKAQLPIFMQENPFDTNVARRVKRAYSSLDSVGIRLGVFLRRYPLIRIFAIIYIVVLHLWVMFVLFSSTPN